MSVGEVSSDEWMAQSRWYERTLSAEHAAAILSLADRTNHNTMTGGFFADHPPSPYNDGWTLAQVYTHIAEHDRSGYEAFIPRLFALTTSHGPARMLHAQSVEISYSGPEFVIHAWQPSDGRGPIAIAYPVRDCSGATTPEAAGSLLGILGWATAVVIPADTDDRPPSRWRDPQPAVWVADGRIGTPYGGVDIGIEQATWGDVANLLRTDAPWWSAGLRDRDAMLMWRPGDAPLAIAPGTAGRDPRALLDVLAPDSSPALRHTVIRMVREIEHELCGSFGGIQLGHDHYREFPGFCHAAVADMEFARQHSPRTAGEASLLLHQEVANPITARRAAVVAGGAPIAHSAYVIDDQIAGNELIASWFSRLRRATRRDEIGFHLALSHLPAEVGDADSLPSTSYYCDPLWPDCWIAAEGNTAVTTVGTSVPATGYLTHVYVTSRAAFFRDSAGVVWPLPYPRVVASTADLAQTIARLMIDAGADVDDPAAAVAVDQVLWQRINNAELPWMFNADDAMQQP